MNFSSLIFFCLFVSLIPSSYSGSAFCQAEYCTSGCCKDAYSCQVLTSSDKSSLKYCYSGDCSIIKCGSSMCCSNGKCYNNDDEVCKSTSTSSSSTAVIIIAIFIPIGVCIVLILIYIYWRKKKYARYNEAPIVQAQLNIVNNNYPAQSNDQQQPQYNNQQQPQYDDQQQQQPQYNNQKSIPINNVILPNGQPYFPDEPNKQGDYAVHESQMGQFNNNVKIVGQPLPDNINYGYNYPTKQ